MRNFTIFSAFLLFTLTATATDVEHQSYIVMSPDDSRTIVEVPQEMKDLGEERKRQIKEHGYFPTYSEYAVNLTSYKDKRGTHESLPHDVPYFETLRLNTTDFSLSFPFNGFPSVDEKNLLGFVPAGSYEEGEWTGLAAFFITPNDWVCSLTIFDMQSIKGKSIYDSRFTTFDINKKPTWTSVSGSPESGFVYEASWTGARYEKMLDCANAKPFDPRGLKDLIAFAKKIDNDLPDTP